jgi:hypothetical protein
MPFSAGLLAQHSARCVCPLSLNAVWYYILSVQVCQGGNITFRDIFSHRNVRGSRRVVLVLPQLRQNMYGAAQAALRA